jgi:group II intron reverse transcriptase/maturase
LEQGGKAAAVSQSTGQLSLFSETADSPQGDVSDLDVGQPTPRSRAVPKSKSKQGSVLPSMVLEEMASIDNLRRAFRQVRLNHGAPGPDGRTVEDVEKTLSTLLPRLQRGLLGGTYQPGLIRRVWIPKSGTGGGLRGLGIPNVVDRLVAQAVLQILSPHYEPTFHDSSHGFRPGRGCHTAIAEAQTHLEEGREWVVDFDLSKFFDRVNHQRLLDRLAQRIEDRRVLRLIRLMLKAKVVLPNGVVVSTEEGTPQGGPLSPLLSNIVLDELDWELDRRGHRFVRYADDANIYVSSERAGHRVMASITRFIEGRLRLQINQEKSAVAKPDERHFLGFRLCRSADSGEVNLHLSKRSRTRINERIVALTPRNWGRSISDCIQRVNQYTTGWLSHFAVCTPAGADEFKFLDGRIRRRLRAMQLKQWKRKRTIVKRLIELGVKRVTAWKGIYKGRKALWALAHSSPVDRGLPNALWAKRGLVSIWSKWQVRYAERHIDLKQLLLALE